MSGSCAGAVAELGTLPEAEPSAAGSGMACAWVASLDGIAARAGGGGAGGASGRTCPQSSSWENEGRR